MESRATDQFNLKDRVDGALEELRAIVEAKLPVWLGARSGPAFRSAELEIARVGQDFADKTVAAMLLELSGATDLRADILSAARGGSKKLRHGGRRDVDVRLLGGGKVRVRVDYLREDYRGRAGRKRGQGRRGPNGTGFYPLLAALGVSQGATPALAGEILRQVVDSDSVRAGRSALARRGMDLGHKQTLRLVNNLGGRAVQKRNIWLEGAAAGPREAKPVLRDKRVIVTIDGGRLRERCVLPGRPRTKTGRHRYSAPWREPKLFAIYVVDEAGEMDETFRPVYDGTLGDCDAVFDMVHGYLRALGADQAAEVTFVADGAIWIWERTALLAEKVGIPVDRVREVIDWYHATETLHEVAKARTRLSQARRDRWLERAKTSLHAGNIDGVMGLFDELAVGRGARAISTHRDYFLRNAERMQYSTFEAQNIVCGSGAVESAVRRVINMRMKGNGTFWKRTNAESMILLRCYLKAGRYDDLIDWTIATEAPWWPEHSTNHSPLAEIGRPEHSQEMAA